MPRRRTQPQVIQPQTQEPPNNVASISPYSKILLAGIVFLLTLVAFFFVGYKITSIVVVFVIVWLVDVLMKSNAKISNSTMFADLSFSALVSMATAIPTHIVINSTTAKEGTFILGAALLVLYLLNIGLGSEIETKERQNKEPMAITNGLRVASSLLALFSVVVALIMLVVELK